MSSEFPTVGGVGAWLSYSLTSGYLRATRGQLDGVLIWKPEWGKPALASELLLCCQNLSLKVRAPRSLCSCWLSLWGPYCPEEALCSPLLYGPSITQSLQS